MMFDDAPLETPPSEARPHTRSPRVLDLDALLEGMFHVSAVNRSCDSWVFDLTPSASVGRPRRCERERHIVSALLSGSSQKQIGIELCLAPATVSVEIRRLLRRIGVARWEHFVAIACALHRTRAPAHDADAPRKSVQISAMARPQVLAALTPAEREVVLYVADGLSNAQIASRRRTSPRTIANQIAGTFRKLDVQGRLELILMMLADDATPS